MTTRVLVFLAMVALAGCGDRGADPAAERGRQVYLAQCTACHASDPAQNGPIGPAIKGSPKTLLEAKLLKGTYPPGYPPKRPTTVMQPMPQMGGSIDDLVAYLR
jgi:mono/diheme cytochrome c family protein